MGIGFVRFPFFIGFTLVYGVFNNQHHKAADDGYGEKT